jgi:ABC-type sugar transport system substrate-binding protein
MDNFITSGANLILLIAADSKGIAPAVMRAKAADVTVVAVDVGAEGGVDATVTSNNKQAGQLDGKYVADRLKGKGQLSLADDQFINIYGCARHQWTVQPNSLDRRPVFVRLGIRQLVGRP